MQYVQDSVVYEENHRHFASSRVFLTPYLLGDVAQGESTTFAR